MSEDVRAQCVIEDLKEMLQIADRDLCPECKREASEPCPCFETE